MTAAGGPIVALRDAARAFGAVRALDGVTLAIAPGECVGLVGHNGAGKSTLVSLVTGALAPTAGHVAFAGGDARASGIRSVAQELSLCPNLTLAENLRVAHPPGGLGWRRAARDRMARALDAVFPGHGIDASAPVGDLPLARRQMAEVAMAFAAGPVAPRLVILDEPTSSLDAAVAGQLLAHLRGFCAGGGAAVFISHVLPEVLAVATRVVVLRDGRVTADRPAGAFTRAALVEAMGHIVQGGAREGRARRAPPAGAPLVVDAPEGIQARRGEVVGLAGLAGHGQAAALGRLYRRLTSGWGGGAPGAAFVAGDRAREGVMPLWSIRRNVTLARLSALTRRGLVDRAAEATLAEGWRGRIGIRTADMSDPILSLSGGNQQKALFARALATDAPVILMDDPLRGVDVGTKAAIYDLIRAEAAGGRTFLWSSTEAEETTLCDRAYVFRAGRVAAELRGAEITEAALLAASFEMGEAPA